MEKRDWKLVSRARAAALQVLLHNVHGPYRGLPRTAGWGYPEPYTRDMMISSLGILVSGNGRLMKSLQRVLDTAAANQSRLGHIPSLVHDKEDRGASDCTPLFLMAAGMFRIATERPDFLEEAVAKAMTWVEHQSPSDRVLVAQLPTSDWRDEQWVLGYGLFVNTLINFLIVAFVLFLVVKAMNRLERERAAPAAVPTTKDCPYCLSTIPIKATRCPHCTSEL